MWQVGKADYCAPLVVVQILAGILLGPGALLFAPVAGKRVGVHVAGRVRHWQPGESTVIGWLLQTKALIMIICANILLDKSIITSETFTALLQMAVGSTMLTVPVVSLMLRRATELTSRSA